MPIALESGRQHGGAGARFGGGVPRYAPPPEAVAACGGSSSSGRGSDSRMAMVQCEEAEESDGEVQSPYKGPLDTVDALKDALPRRTPESKFFNSKSSSLANATDAVTSSEPAKDLASPENPSPKKRKGLHPFGNDQNELESKEPSHVADDTDSPLHCRKPLYPAVTSNAPLKNKSDNEHECCKNLPCHCLLRRFDAMSVTASRPVARMTSVSTVGQQDVAVSTAVVSPREKRRKS